MLTITKEYNGTFCSSYSRKSTTSLSMSVEFGNNNTSNLDSFIKGLSLSKTLLTNRTVHNENNFIRLDCSLDLLHLFKQFSFLFVPTRSIHNDNLHTFLLEFLNTLPSNFDRVSLTVAAIEGNSNPGSILFQLIECTSTECISTNHGNSPALLFVVVSIFGTSGCFTTSLQTDKHHNIRFSFLGLEGFSLNVEQVSQLSDYLSLNQGS